MTGHAMRYGLRAHAKRRARSRYGFHLSSRAYDRLVQEIRQGRALATIRVTSTRIICLVEHEARLLVAVYSTKHNFIVTFLPDDCYERQQLERIRDEQKPALPVSDQALPAA